MSSLEAGARNESRVHGGDPGAPAWLARRLRLAMAGCAPEREVVVLCIGTDRSTGDALGPLVGSRLQEARLPWRVLGTVDEPVHATNLERTLQSLGEGGPRPYVIAIDACLGRLENVGTIGIAPGPLTPGAGVNKSLPPVGDVAVTGTVNVGGFMEYLILQNTRLAVVLQLARAIAEGVIRAASAEGRVSRAVREAAVARDPQAERPGGASPRAFTPGRSR